MLFLPGCDLDTIFIFFYNFGRMLFIHGSRSHHLQHTVAWHVHPHPGQCVLSTTMHRKADCACLTTCVGTIAQLQSNGKGYQKFGGHSDPSLSLLFPLLNLDMASHIRVWLLGPDAPEGAVWMHSSNVAASLRYVPEEGWSASSTLRFIRLPLPMAEACAFAAARCWQDAAWVSTVQAF